MSSPRPAAPTDPAAWRRRLLALHRRHAGRLRAAFYWLGADLEAIDGAVLRSFLLADRRGRAPVGADERAWLGHLAWQVASRPMLPDERALEAPVLAPRLPPEADLLARLLATHASEPEARAAFVLAELCGLGPIEIAGLLASDAPAVARTLADLRRAIAHDPEVVAAGGPARVLAASLAPFERDLEWQREHAALLLGRGEVAGPAGLSDMLRQPRVIVGIGAAVIVALLLLRPGPPAAPVKRVAPVAVAVPVPAPPVIAPPPPLPVPVDMSPTPAPVRKVARGRGRPPRGPDAKLAEREKLAQARDPGAIIVELEMLGAGRKLLTSNPRQALAYADQHARDYPDSQLAAQRAELRVRALCALGRKDDARTEAARRAAPKVQDALREACR